MPKALTADVGFDENFVTSLRITHGVWQAAKLKCMVEGLQLGTEIEKLLRAWVDPEYLTLARRSHDLAAQGRSAPSGAPPPHATRSKRGRIEGEDLI